METFGTRCVYLQIDAFSPEPVIETRCQNWYFRTTVYNFRNNNVNSTYRAQHAHDSSIMKTNFRTLHDPLWIEMCVMKALLFQMIYSQGPLMWTFRLMLHYKWTFQMHWVRETKWNSPSIRRYASDVRKYGWVAKRSYRDTVLIFISFLQTNINREWGKWKNQ